MNKDKRFKELKTDAEAIEEVETIDLSEYDLSGFKPVRFEFEKKAAALNMRIPQSLLEAVKTKAASKGVPFTRYVRMLIEQDVARPK